MTITGTGGTGCEDHSQPLEPRPPPASSHQGGALLLDQLFAAPADLPSGGGHRSYCVDTTLPHIASW
jgi:hypothetical protein